MDHYALRRSVRDIRVPYVELCAGTNQNVQVTVPHMLVNSLLVKVIKFTAGTPSDVTTEYTPSAGVATKVGADERGSVLIFYFENVA